MKLRLILASSLATLVTSYTALAASGTWTSTTPGNWSDATKWSNATVADGAGSLADFNSVDLPAGTLTVTLDSARTIGGLTFGDTNTATAGAWSLTNNNIAANVLTLASGTAPIITVNPLAAGLRATIATNLAGTQGFTKAGTGTLALANANSFTAAAVINNTAGTLVLNNNAALGSASLRLGAGSTLDSTATNIVLSNHSEVWDGDFTYTGTQNLNLGAGLVTMTGSRTIAVNANVLTVGGNITTSPSAGANYALTKTGSGTLALNGTTDYTGTTTVSVGVLRIGNAGALANTDSIVVANLARLELSGGITVADKTITLNGNGFNNIGALSNFSGENTWAGSVVLNTNARVGVTAGVLNITGQIVDGAGTTGLAIRNSTGTDNSMVRLSRQNFYDGNTDIVVGTLQLGVDNAVPNRNMNMGNNSAQGGAATLDLNGHTQFLANLAPVTGNSIVVRVVNSNAATPGLLALFQTSDNSTGTVNANGTGGIIFGNTGQNNFEIFKGGNFTYTMASSSTYSRGTTVNEGVIRATINGALGTGDVTVTANSAGDGGLPIKLTLATGVTDAIANTATLSLAGGLVANTADSGFLELETGVTETVANLLLGGVRRAPGTYGSSTSSAQFKLNEYFAGTGVLTVLVPEPTSLASLLGGLGILASARRLRRVARFSAES